jgi:hypothetical protein
MALNTDDKEPKGEKVVEGEGREECATRTPSKFRRRHSRTLLKGFISNICESRSNYSRLETKLRDSLLRFSRLELIGERR